MALFSNWSIAGVAKWLAEALSRRAAYIYFESKLVMKCALQAEIHCWCGN